MVLIKMLPQPGVKLNLTQLHSAVHNLVLSRREDVGFWEGPFETAWAGFVFASHSASNKDERAINLIKGELLGDKRPVDPGSASELAACYIIAAFLQRINASEIAVDFVALANTRVLEMVAHIELEERFHLLSTPEYLYAIVLAHNITEQKMPDKVADTVQSSLDRIRDAGWHQSGYVFALAGTAYLTAHDYSEVACQTVLQWLDPRLNADEIDEHSLPFLWFLERNWSQIRTRVSEEQQNSIEDAFIRLRSRLLHSLGQFDFQLAWCPPMEVEYEESLSGPLLIVSTIELLMLDEIAEKHSEQSFVLTQEELDRHNLLSTVFNQYKQRVDNRLAELGLGDQLDAVYRGLEDNNPASWQQAILGCRNVFYELSGVLWQIPGDEYVIPGISKPLSVKAGSGNEKNRLTAYLHYRGISKSKEPVFLAQFEAASNLMHALVDRSAKAKHTITLDEALSLLMATYVLLAEMIALTGLEPAIELI